MGSVLILGYGYTAGILRQKLGEGVDVTFRKNEPESRSVLKMQFELEDRSSWEVIQKSYDSTIWTFPASSFELVRDFLDEKGSFLGRNVVIGSTGNYLSTKDDEEIRESSVLDLSSERVRAEELIRERGGLVVRASGIYGPRRNPVQWLKQGRIRPNPKYVNFIHVEDLCEILLKARDRGQPKTNYIASDGKPYRWQELADLWQNEFNFTVPENAAESPRPSRRINPSQTLKDFSIHLRYPNVVEGVRNLTNLL